jgi:uncharacterized protein, YhcH/YjgK/YiaL family
MILDNIKNAHLYYNVSDRLALGLKYLQETDLASLEPGKYEIDGKNVYAAVSAYDSRPVEQGKWEAHKNYIDIQYIISGEEKMGYAHIADMASSTEYNDVKDVEFYKGNGDFFTVKAGFFAVFAPEDVHMPNIAVNEPSAVKKVVVKVLV